MTFYEIAQTLKALHSMDGGLANDASNLIWMGLHKAGDADAVQQHMDDDGLYPYLKEQGFFGE
tara:strand:+ start:277 stop:465 length:189 start_codon:yes stop_codon:yes gene_type:complete